MNFWLIFLWTTSFIVATVLIYFLRRFAIKHRLFDEPGNNKIHSKPVPYLGGIGIFGATSITLTVATYIGLLSAAWTIGIIFSGSIILALGLWDDLKWKQSGRTFLKLGLQCLISLSIVLFFIERGILITHPLGAILFATLYIVVVINALNVNDGMDGLAGGMVALSLIGFIVLSLGSGNVSVFIISGVLLFSVFGFLIYNWQPASIFMGDNGSLFLGLTLAIIAIIFTGYPLYNFRHFFGSSLIIGFPLFDIACVILTRSINGRSPFCKSRDYLYDKIHTTLGFSIRQTVMICYFIQMVFVISGVLLY